MQMIVAVDRNWAIGCKGCLLVSIPDDMKFFRQMTTGKVIVMGRKTLESFPHGKPLPNRINIVMTRDKRFSKEGVIVAHNRQELELLLSDYASEDIFVVGGESIYRLLEPLCDRAYVTKIDYSYEADVHFPNLDQRKDWHCVQCSEEQTYYDMEYYFTTYERSKEIS